ncbi:MAG: putative polysaccharide lyase family 8 [Phycisphaerales bacterium]|nr:putative polysaccharide lyase family 8 [Phycisphaerales bacterium]
MQLRNGAVIFAVAIAALPALARAQDIERLARNIYDGAITPSPSAEAIQAILTDVQADGSYRSIDYASTSRASWKPQGHLSRLNDLANAWCDPKSPGYHAPAVKDAILKGYDLWVQNDYQSSNWFYNVIGVPERLGSLMLKMQQNGFLPTQSFSQAIRILHRSAKGQGGASTGANLASQAACTIHEGILRYRAPGASASEKTAASALIQKSYDYLGSTLAPALNLEDDGIRVDQSYQSHEQSLYDAGYGASLLGNTARAAAWGAGTGYGLSVANVRHMVDYLLDGGPQWMVRGLTYDPLAGGRYWSRPTQVNTAASLRGPIDIAISLCGDYRRSELVTLRNRLADAVAGKTASPTLGPTGNRAYWISDYMVHQRPGFMISVNGASKRTNTPESINGENLKAGYGTAGVNLIFRSGHEYDGIYSAWDWYRLPGTTSERSADGTGGNYSILPDHHFGKTDAVGGASDGNTGAFAYQMSEYGITANKAYFFFDRGMVALGNSIKQSAASAPGGVGTNLNQTLLHGGAVYSDADGKTATLESGKIVRPKGLRWVNHDSVAYLFFTPTQSATLRAVRQTGSWQSINNSGSRETIATDVFSLDLDHGPHPTGGAYAYAVVPNVASTATEALEKSNPFTVLRNDATVQAVKSGNRTEAIYYGNGSIAVAEGVELSKIGRASTVSILWSKVDQTATMSVANIDRRGGPLTFTVSQHLRGDGATYDPATGLTTVTIQPPTGDRAGSTVTLKLDAVPGPQQ